MFNPENQNLFVTDEMCPHCEAEHEISNIVQPCPTCGKPLVACSMCKAINPNVEVGFCSGCSNGSKFVLATAKDFNALSD